MTVKIFKKPKELQSFFETSCNQAIENACDRLLYMLQKAYHYGYYGKYTPGPYSQIVPCYKEAIMATLFKICQQFLEDPAKAYVTDYQLNELNHASDKIRQLTGDLTARGGWSGQEGEKYMYWNSFEDYCKKNMVSILMEELVRQGVDVK